MENSLLIAVEKNHVECARLLLGHGCCPNNVSNINDGTSLLQIGIAFGSIEICQLLLKHGANPDQYNHTGETPRAVLFSVNELEGYSVLRKLVEEEYPCITQVEKKWDEYSRRYRHNRSSRKFLSLDDIYED